MTIRRRLRAVAGVAVVWGLALSTVATTLLVLAIAFDLVPRSVFGGRTVFAVAQRAFVSGALAGALFAALLAGTERRTTLARLSTRRVALWGCLGGAAIPNVVAIALGLTGLLPLAVLAVGTLGWAALGSAMAVATLRLARRGQRLAVMAGEEPDAPARLAGTP